MAGILAIVLKTMLVILQADACKKKKESVLGPHPKDLLNQTFVGWVLGIIILVSFLEGASGHQCV